MKIKPMLFAAAGAALFALTANAQDAQLNKEVGRYVYSCEGGKNLEVVYVNAGNKSYAIINQVDEMVPMIQTKSASGANYKALSKNYTYQLYTKGKFADLVEGNDKPVLSNCSL